MRELGPKRGRAKGRKAARRPAGAKGKRPNGQPGSQHDSEKCGETGCKRAKTGAQQNGQRDKSPGGRFAESDGLELMRPARLAA